MTASLFDKRTERYWQGLPLHRMTGVLLAFFFTFSGFAFLLDLFNWQGLPLWALLVSAALIGANAVAFFVILSRRHFKLLPLLVVLAAAVIYVLGRLPHGSPIAVTAAAHKRMVLDATGIVVVTFLGAHPIWTPSALNRKWISPPEFCAGPVRFYAGIFVVIGRHGRLGCGVRGTKHRCQRETPGRHKPPQYAGVSLIGTPGASNPASLTGFLPFGSLCFRFLLDRQFFNCMLGRLADRN